MKKPTSATGGKRSLKDLKFDSRYNNDAINKAVKDENVCQFRDPFNSFDSCVGQTVVFGKFFEEVENGTLSYKDEIPKDSRLLHEEGTGHSDTAATAATEHSDTPATEHSETAARPGATHQ